MLCFNFWGFIHHHCTWWCLKGWCSGCHRIAFWFTSRFPFSRLHVLYLEGEADPIFANTSILDVWLVSWGIYCHTSYVALDDKLFISDTSYERCLRSPWFYNLPEARSQPVCFSWSAISIYFNDPSSFRLNAGGEPSNTWLWQCGRAPRWAVWKNSLSMIKGTDILSSPINECTLTVHIMGVQDH